MSRQSIDDAKPWFLQAASDARTAEALHRIPSPMVEADAGCHVAAICAQAIEKSLKGYVLLNGKTPAMNHRPDKYIFLLLRDDLFLQYEHRGILSKLFDRATRDSVTQLLDLTPGGVGNGNNAPNTEYPWTTEANRWRFAPAVDPLANGETIRAWLNAGKRVSGTLQKLWVAVDRATAI